MNSYRTSRFFCTDRIRAIITPLLSAYERTPVNFQHRTTEYQRSITELRETLTDKDSRR